jgi:hypothetical protein
MPFQFQELTTSSGIPYLRVDVSAQVDLADGQALEAYLLRPSMRNARVLSVVAKGTEYSPEVRKFFPALNDKYVKLAAIVTNPIVRAAINMMLRLKPVEGGLFRMFASEQEALEWLESPEA